jgi:hypothetical protein
MAKKKGYYEFAGGIVRKLTEEEEREFSDSKFGFFRFKDDGSLWREPSRVDHGQHLAGFKAWAASE